MTQERKQSKKTIKEKVRNLHPMWFLIFVILGYVLYILLNRISPLLFLFFLVIGIIVFVSMKKTPSEFTKFEKTKRQTTLV